MSVTLLAIVGDFSGVFLAKVVQPQSEVFVGDKFSELHSMVIFYVGFVCCHPRDFLSARQRNPPKSGDIR